MKFKMRQVIGIIFGLSLGTIIFFVLSKTNGKISDIYYNILTPMIMAVFLILISLDKRLDNPQLADKDPSLKFLKKFRILFLITGFISLIVFLVNVGSLFSTETNKQNKYKEGWTDANIKSAIELLYKSMPESVAKYPKEYYKFCDCAVNKYKVTLNYREYLDKNITKEKDERNKFIIKECADTFRKDLEKVMNNK